MNTGVPFITLDPKRRGGWACVRDLRIGVGAVAGWPAQGMTAEQVLVNYPRPSYENLRACLACAAARGEAHKMHRPSERAF